MKRSNARTAQGRRREEAQSARNLEKRQELLFREDGPPIPGTADYPAKQVKWEKKWGAWLLEREKENRGDGKAAHFALADGIFRPDQTRIIQALVEKYFGSGSATSALLCRK